MSAILKDARHALRSFRQHPGAPLLIVLSLGAAMGINTSLFTVVNAVWFSPWAVPHPANIRIVEPAIPYSQFLALRRHGAHSLSGLSGFVNVLARLEGERLHQVQLVSDNFFDVLGVSITGVEQFRSAPSTSVVPAIVSESLWNELFGGNFTANHTLIIHGLTRTSSSVAVMIVGRADPAFDGIDQVQRTDVWLPLDRAPSLHSILPSTPVLPVTAFGRLSPGASPEAATRELSSVLTAFQNHAPALGRPIRVSGTSTYARVGLSGDVLRMWESLLVGVVFLSLIVCANVGNLLLARGYARRGEIAVRFALGASRRRLIVQQLTETVLLIIAASAVGLLIGLRLPAVIENEAMGTIAPNLGSLFRLHITFDRGLFFWLFGLAVFTSAVFGIAPALTTTRLEPNEVMKESQGASKRGLKASLLTYQTLVSVSALCVAGLLLRSEPVTQARRLLADFEGITAVRVERAAGPSRPSDDRLAATLLQRMQSTVGSDKVAGMAKAPITGGAQVLDVTATYFSVLQIPVSDLSTFRPGTDVVIINQACAQRYWPSAEAIGQRLPKTDLWNDSLTGMKVAAVVSDAFLNPVVYRAIPTTEARIFLIRAPHNRVAAALENIGAPDADVTAVSGRKWLASVAGPATVAAWLTLGFAVCGLLLGSLGLFSLLEYTVAQRRRELGIRRALGATAAHIFLAVTQSGFVPIARGTVLGVLTGAAIGTYMQRFQLPDGIHPADIPTYGIIILIVATAAALASIGPVARAIRVEPASTLQER